MDGGEERKPRRDGDERLRLPISTKRLMKNWGNVPVSLPRLPVSGQEHQITGKDRRADWYRCDDKTLLLRNLVGRETDVRNDDLK